MRREDSIISNDESENSEDLEHYVSNFKVKVKAEEDGAIGVLNRTPNAAREQAASRLKNASTGTTTEIMKASTFDSRYHFRRTNECARCASSPTRDCFFPQEFKPTGSALHKCTNCKRSGYRCEYTNDAVNKQSVSTTHSNTASPSTASSKPAPVSAPSASASVMPSMPPSSAPAAIPATLSSNTTTKNGKRKADSEPMGSSPPQSKHVRGSSPQSFGQSGASVVPGSSQVDVKATLLRQATRLNISFKSFMDLDNQQTESDDDRCVKEASVGYCKQEYEMCKKDFEKQERAYRESKRRFEEKKQVFKENKQLYEESVSVWAATQEWLAARSESAGENLIEEATSLLSSIEKYPGSLLDIAPALQRLRTAFDAFTEVRCLPPIYPSEARNFVEGARAEHLRALIGRIEALMHDEIPAADGSS